MSFGFDIMVTFLHYLFSALWWLYFDVFFPLACAIAFYLLIVSAFNIHSGLQTLYTKSLLKLFEFCSRTIERKQKRDRLNSLRKNQSTDEDSNDEEFKASRPDLLEAKTNGDDKLFFDPNSNSMEQKEFDFSEVYYFLTQGIKAIVDDEVTKRFAAEELQTWNLLTRTYKTVKVHSFKLNVLWFIGFIIRFLILFPIRFVIFVIGILFLIQSMLFIGFLPNSAFKRGVYTRISVITFRFLARSLSPIITYHNQEYRAPNGSVCVANHTSPIDVLMLHCDNAYALVGQVHEGFLGFLQKTLSKATHHVFFERSEASDRLGVSRKLKEHVSDRNKLPVLIFPEGTCINNSAVMMFKKGSFEATDVIYPVAIKYNPIFGDAFWNSSKNGYFTYIMMMMTSWAIVCEVWYLEPMHRKDNESSINFANRVKAAIARQGGLVDLDWDGSLKRSQVKPNLKEKVQNIYSRKISVPARHAPRLDLLQDIDQTSSKSCDNSPTKEFEEKKVL